MKARGPRGPLLTALAVAAVLGVVAVRFHAFLLGSVAYFRDTGYFFVPLRHVMRTLLLAGEFPVWNDWMSNGRAFAANPIAAVFWPLSPLVVAVGPTFLNLLNASAAVLAVFAALRWIGLTRTAAVAGSCVFLLSGVFQSLVSLFSPLSAAAPLPLAVVLAVSLEPKGGRRAWAHAAGAALALGLSVLGGEPVVTLVGGSGIALLLAARAGADLWGGDRESAVRRIGFGAAIALLAAGLAAVQILPAAGELARSARGRTMRPQEGALFFSVRPSRLLTLLEPRLTGDPFAEDHEGYWGAGTFDAGNPYYYDLALGLIPLALAAASARDRRGRAALLLAAMGAFLSFGRYLPGYAGAVALAPVFRYPEKWWLLATLGLVGASAVGADLLLRDGAARRPALTDLRRASTVLAGLLGLLFAVGTAAPGLLRSCLWGLGLGDGNASPERVASLLLPLLASGAAGMGFVALLASWVEKGRLRPAALATAMVLVFLGDATRRTAGSCPAGPADLYVRTTPGLEAVRAEISRGRFYDDGADDPIVAVRRASEAGGFDPLRPTTGVVFGIRYAFENDVDRMTPADSVAAVASLARSPWGPEKVERLRAANVAVVRTPSSGPDPAGVRELLRAGGDRILAIDPTRPEFFAEGRPVEALERRSSRQTLRVASGPEAVLRIARTFDPNWKASVNGRPSLLRSEGALSALDLPAGEAFVEMRYDNPRFGLGAAVSTLSLAAILVLLARGRRTS
ncbi:MAG TPA: hypothetical protein VF580_02525 [Thermoanaerobaculia bacterium]